MNRFQKQKKPFKKVLLPLVSAGIFLLIFVFFYSRVSSLSKNTLSEQQKNLKSAIQKSAVHCYAVEGAYPESLDYLKEHYGITYDPDKFIVDYEIIGSNLMPDVTVFLRKGGIS